MSKNRYAIQLFSVKDELAMDMWGTLKTLKKMGFEAVEFFGEFGHTAQEYKAALDDAGLLCCGWHTPWENVQENVIMSTISFNKTIGNQNIIIPGLPYHMTCSKKAWMETCQQFNNIYEILSAYGMNLGYHNHDTEFTDMGGETALDIFLNNTHPDILLQFDCGNALAGNASIMNEYKKCADRLKTVHLKPYSIEHGGYATMMGEDDIPWQELLAAILQKNVTDWLIVEYESAKYHQFEGVHLFVNKLKDMMK